jgi:hypothetical protein
MTAARAAPISCRRTIERTDSGAGHGDVVEIDGDDGE